MRKSPIHSRGFTLIELSIVLVIIGLVVGGVLVGQNLIYAAAVRAQITQIEKYNPAANTFYGKYGYLPGDIPDPAATTFGFQARGGGAPGEGDENHLIEGISSLGYGDLNEFTGEQASERPPAPHCSRPLPPESAQSRQINA